MESLGGMVGSKLLNKIPDKYLKFAFAMFLMYAGINMLFLKCVVLFPLAYICKFIIYTVNVLLIIALNDLQKGRLKDIN